MPTYDFRCSRCGRMFELTRSFNQSGNPAACPHDGAEAVRLFSPPLDLLMYRREQVVDTSPVRIPPGALSCHDHGPPPSAEGDDRAEHAGSRWHAHGYETPAGEPVGHGQAHGHGHSHSQGHSHGQHHSH